MGQFLKAMPKNKGGDPLPKTKGVNEPETLKEIGITYKQSSSAQKLADIPAPEFHREGRFRPLSVPLNPVPC
jgi:hypothetical protein